MCNTFYIFFMNTINFIPKGHCFDLIYVQSFDL